MSEVFIAHEGESAPPAIPVFVVGRHLYTGSDEIERRYGPLAPPESDLLLIAASVFAADRATPRGERENVSRSIRLSVPIQSIDILQPLTHSIEAILLRLTDDSWELHFRSSPLRSSVYQRALPADSFTLLFSGGLDSMAAAIEFGSTHKTGLLVSHHTRNRIVTNAQSSLAAILASQGYAYNHLPLFVSSRTPPFLGISHDEESSQRSRSFMFLVLAAVASVKAGNGTLILLGENGQLAVNLPLTQGRIGAFSTHTAHPQVLRDVEALVNQALHAHLRIFNPYEGRTKREVAMVVHENAPEAVPVTNSCWRNARLSPPHTHCGECFPCLVRRIALEAIGTDPTSYARDPWSEDLPALSPDDDARRNTSDLAEFVHRFASSSDEEIMSEWPELYSGAIDAPQTIAMYRRFSQEARAVMSNYPSLAGLLR